MNIAMRGFVSFVVAVVAVFGSHGATCRTLHPDPAALREAVAALPAGPRLLADKVADAGPIAVDILIAFDASAVRWLADNEKDAPEEYAGGCVEKMNRCLEQSRITEFIFRLAGTVVVNQDLSGVDLQEIVRERLVNATGRVVASGELKKITDTREAVGADIVSLLVDNQWTDYVGIGYSLEGRKLSEVPAFGNWAYNVCCIEAVDRTYTQVHEIGHNMGCGHPDAALVNPAAVDPGPQFAGYSAGFYFWHEDIGYCTVMAYNFGGIGPNGEHDYKGSFAQLPMFSSPLLEYDGVLVGDADHDNRRTLLETCRYVAQYRGPKEPVLSFPKKTVNAVVLSGDKPAGLFQVTVAKSDKKGQSKVSGFFVGPDGKKKAAKAVKAGVIGIGGVSTVSDVPLTVKGEPALTVSVGVDGTISGRFGDGRVLAAADSIGTLASATPAFSLDDGAPPIPGLLNDVTTGGVDYHLVPDGEGFGFSAGGSKWVFAKNASIKFKKNKQSGRMELLVDTGKDGSKTNFASVKLSSAVKTGILKGSFTLYGDVGTAEKPKLAKYKAKITGFIVNGAGYGVGVLKKPYCEMPVSVK